MIDHFDIYSLGDDIYAITQHGMFNKRILGIHLSKNPQVAFEFCLSYVDSTSMISNLVTWLVFYENDILGNNTERHEILMRVRSGKLVLKNQEIQYHDIIRW